MYHEQDYETFCRITAYFYCKNDIYNISRLIPFKGNAYSRIKHSNSNSSSVAAYLMKFSKAKA